MDAEKNHFEIDSDHIACYSFKFRHFLNGSLLFCDEATLD